MLKGHSVFGRSWRSLLNFHLREEKVENTFSKEESSLVRLGLLFIVVWLHPCFYYVGLKIVFLLRNREHKRSVAPMLAAGGSKTSLNCKGKSGSVF